MSVDYTDITIHFIDRLFVSRLHCARLQSSFENKELVWHVLTCSESPRNQPLVSV